MRIFVVVAKNRRDLYQYFVHGFDGVGDIEVILDRRIGPEAPASGGHLIDEYGNRRIARDVYEELQDRGFVIVRLPGK